MKLRTHFLLAATLTLVLGLGSGVMAQTARKSSVAIAPPEPIFTAVKVNAIETSAGVMGIDAQQKQETLYGYTFLGRTSGSYPGSFTLSMNCIPAQSTGDVTQITGGSWTLPVYVASKGGSIYAGSLYGTIAKGEMVWDKVAGGTAVNFALNVDGGTQSWPGALGYAYFTGLLYYDEKSEANVLEGTLSFYMGKDFAKAAK